jgi:Uma2 family endonuclease
MDVMEAPRTRQSKPPQQREPEQQRPVPAPTADEPDDPQLWEFFQNLDLGDDRFRVEFIEGTIVVRGFAPEWHEEVITWLVDQFRESCQANGWKRAGKGILPDLPAPARSIGPDLLIYESDSGAREDWCFASSHVRLVAEVVSRGTARADRTLKPLSCARAGIELYLCVDRFVTPVTVTLLSKPDPDGYQRLEAIPAGPGGGKLTIPEPFGIILDLSTVPVP